MYTCQCKKEDGFSGKCFLYKKTVIVSEFAIGDL